MKLHLLAFPVLVVGSLVLGAACNTATTPAASSAHDQAGQPRLRPSSSG